MLVVHDEAAQLAGAWQSFWHDVREDALGSNHRPGTLTTLVIDAKKEVLIHAFETARERRYRLSSLTGTRL